MEYLPTLNGKGVNVCRYVCRYQIKNRIINNLETLRSYKILTRSLENILNLGQENSKLGLGNFSKKITGKRHKN